MFLFTKRNNYNSEKSAIPGTTAEVTKKIKEIYRRIVKIRHGFISTVRPENYMVCAINKMYQQNS